MGLGDILRGAIGLYIYCKKNNYDFYIDSQNHILNNFLIINNNPYHKYISDNSKNINFILHKNVNKYIKNFNENKPVIIYTNMTFSELELDINCKKFFIDNFLVPNDIVKNKINKLLENFENKNDYEIIHCRLNDDEFLNSSSEEKYINIYNKIEKYINKNSILLTNSKYFKEYLKNNNKNIYQFDTNPSHIGYKESNDDSIIDTLSEFFIMSKSKKIYTYSEYSWISGFAKIINDIYDVPLFDIK